MTNICIHGLGQTDKSWDKVKEILNKDNINIETPNLFDITTNCQMNYENMYKAFTDYCNCFEEKVNSIILCGVPYEVPKKLFKIQNFIFKFIPKKTFENMGVSKENFIKLTNSMAELNIKEKIAKIRCHTLIMWRKGYGKLRKCK